ncbi:MAG TPA: primosomal protein N' [Leucothrix mucor]|nr:primosomal protein N' [Leucothrix mucor]
MLFSDEIFSLNIKKCLIQFYTKNHPKRFSCYTLFVDESNIKNPINSTTIRAVIQRPIYKSLDYDCSIVPLPSIGCRVRVPLGNSVVTALVIKTNVTSEFKKLKSVIEVLDDKPLLDKPMLGLLTWASRYYLHPLGEVLFHALPVALRNGKAIPKLTLWRLSEAGVVLSADDLKRAPKQLAMWKLLKQGELGAQPLQQTFGKSWRTILNQLDKKELLSQREVDADFVEKKSDEIILPKIELTLTDEQDNCFTQINSYFQEDKPKPILLHGITGSGKTEVYLRAITPIVNTGKQVLVLIPEIGLTPQLLQRFKEHFPQLSIASLHSGLANGERLSVWMGAKSGSIDIVIGTRSAVFTSMKNLGAILIDEEHDVSFKQQEGFLYQARDMAIKRAYDVNIPILLGSATPSLESLHNVNLQRYHYLRLASRPGTRKPPEMVLQDIRTLPLEAGISSLMMQEIKLHINNHNQVMLFLNRRGFAPVLMCPSCGWHAHCNRCETGMTYHAAASKIICHHCGIEQIIKPVCPQCNSPKITTQGQGTERIEQVLNTHFPNTPVIRIDRDSTSRKGSLEKKLKQIHEGEPVILIGTQMLTKGHDFPKLTLVGILDVDQALFSIDYRAQERLTQQVLQVAGRAGRGEAKGRVVLQTSQPEHPILLSLLSQGYYETAKHILNERQLWSYPPYGAQALIRVSADNSDAGFSFLNKLRVGLQATLDENQAKELSLLGPVPSPLAKKANRFRFQLLLSSVRRASLHRGLEKVLIELLNARKTGGVRWSIDTDPMDFL